MEHVELEVMLAEAVLQHNNTRDVEWETTITIRQYTRCRGRVIAAADGGDVLSIVFVGLP